MKRTAKLETHLGTAPLPVTLVYEDQGSLLGSAALVACDMETRSELTPWLASVVVCPESRGNGVGSQLVQGVMAHAAQEGFERMYLVTPDAHNFYARLGWQTMETDVDFHGLRCTLMHAALSKSL